MLKAEHRQIRVQLVGMARALKSGMTERLERSGNAEGVESALKGPLCSAPDGYRLLTFELLDNIKAMREQLAKKSKQWRI